MILANIEKVGRLKHTSMLHFIIFLITSIHKDKFHQADKQR